MSIRIDRSQLEATTDSIDMYISTCIVSDYLDLWGQPTDLLDFARRAQTVALNVFATWRQLAAEGAEDGYDGHLEARERLVSMAEDGLFGHYLVTAEQAREIFTTNRMHE